MANLPTVGADIGIWGTELNNYMLVGHDSSGHHKAVFNIKEYGALCDGATDDTSAWQAAIAACQSAGGGTVQHPGGNSIIASTLTISADNVQIVGQGWGSILTAKAGWSAGTPMLQVQGPGGAGNYRYGIVIRDIFLNGNSLTGVNGIQLVSTYHATLERVRIRYCLGTGVDLQGISGALGAYTTIHACTITDGGAGTAIRTTFHEFNDISGGLIAWYNTAGGYGIYLTNYNNRIRGIVFDECDTAIRVDNCNNNLIQQCQFTRGATRFIALFGAQHNVVQGNYFGTFVGAGSHNILDVSQSSAGNLNNIIEGNVTDAGTGWTNWVVEQAATAAANLYVSNDTAGLPMTLVSGIARGNRGYNPRGQVTAPAFPATTVAATNSTGVDVTAYIANGTAAITQIQIAGASGTYVTTGLQIAASGWGTVRIPAGGSVKFTYASGTPTWTFFGD